MTNNASHKEQIFLSKSGDAYQKLSPEIADKIVTMGKRRLKKSRLHEFSDKSSGKSASERIVSLERIELRSVVGKGSFSIVYDIASIDRKQTKEPLVLKSLRAKHLAKPQSLGGCAADLVKEGMFLSKLNHNNILKCRAWTSNGIDAYEAGTHFAFSLVLERVDTTLYSELKRWREAQYQRENLNVFEKLFRRFSKPQQEQELERQQSNLTQRCQLVSDLVNGLEHLHSRGVLHRDIKPDNLGLAFDGVLKIFDFDVSRIIPNQDSEDELFLMTRRVGSPRYMAPEVALAQRYNAKADVHSFGLVVYEILSLHKPFADLPRKEHDKVVFQQHVRPTVPVHWPQVWKDFLSECWCPKILVRPTMKRAKAKLLDELLPLFLKQQEQSLHQSSNLQKAESHLKTKTTTTNVSPTKSITASSTNTSSIDGTESMPFSIAVF